MPEQIISASGTQYGLIVNPDGSLKANITGSIIIGSVTVHVDSVYVQSGTTFVDTRAPTSNAYNPGIKMDWSSGAGVLGSQLVEVTKAVATGSSVQSLSWTGDTLTNVGSWV